MTGQERIRDVLEHMVKGLVDKEDHVSVKIREGDQTSVFEVRADKSDIGKVIGKKGTMANALRTYLGSLSVKHDVRCIMDIIDR